MNISVFGLGKLGLPFVATMANRGFKVIGIDPNQKAVDAVNTRKPHIYEPRLAEMLNTATNLAATTESYETVKASDVSFVIVPTPSNANGRFETKYVEEACAKIGEAIRDKTTYHLVVITSTVLPSDTEGKIIPVIEKASGKQCGGGFGVCYNPEFIALGNVIQGMLKPDVVLIGESDKRAGDLLAELYKQFCENNPPISRMSIGNAELAKIALNAYVTMKITFANMLAEICEKLPGGDINAITEYLGHDTRIGRKFLSGGLAYGGPCFPRDNKAFISVLELLGVRGKLPSVVDSMNKYHNNRLLFESIVPLNMPIESHIAVLGLTYKPNTDVVEESAAIKLAHRLRDIGARVNVYDPAGMSNAKNVLGKEVTYHQSVKSCLADTELCIVATPWDEFKRLTPDDFIKNMKKAVVFDCWRIYDRKTFSEQLEYHAIGVNQ